MGLDVIFRVFDGWGQEPLQVARDNKLLDLYLETDIDDRSLDHERETSRRARQDMQRSIAELATALAEVEVDWALFKTVRPFPFTPSDIDLVVLSEDGARKLISSLPDQRYVAAGSAPHTLTVCDVETDIGIDFYEDIAASWFVYLDRSTLVPYRSRQSIDGVEVASLEPIAELLTILAHAAFKEQMLTLADYLTLRHYASGFGSDDWQALLQLADANGVHKGVVWCLRIAAGVAEVVFDDLQWPPSIQAVVGAPIVPRRMPFRLISPWKLGGAVLERSRSSGRARRSLAQLAGHALNPASKHTRGFYRQLWLRAKGETY